MGRGAIPYDAAHVVFVARDPADSQRKIVGFYASAQFDERDGYPRASTKVAHLVPAADRPVLSRSSWPGDQGVRRWASRGGAPGKAHDDLMWLFDRLRKGLRAASSQARPHEDQVYADLSGLEGALRLRLERHRTREARMRRAKIEDALARFGGEGLSCEVPGCGFNFAKTYGVLGNGYAQVHHVHPLAKAATSGQTTTLDQLRIVCANCHAMIHRRGASRALEEVVPARRR